MTAKQTPGFPRFTENQGGHSEKTAWIAGKREEGLTFAAL